MDISQLRSNRQFALLQPTAHVLVPGLGYVRLGDHRMPEQPKGPPSGCLPPQGTPNMALFGFIMPGGTLPTVQMHWLADLLLWQPTALTTGNRMAYRPAYLAAHGWKLAT